MTETRLRFGIMCTSTTLAAWQVRCLDAVAERGDAEPALLILDDRPADQGRAVRRLRSLTRRPTVAWWLFERRWVGPRSAATRDVDCTRRFAALPRVLCRPETRGRYSEHFREEELRAIAEHDLDFIVRFGFGIVRGEILQAARHGIWSYHHGDERRFRGGPAGFWELLRAEPTTGAILQRLTDRLDGGIVLHRGRFTTLRHSYLASRDTMFTGAADWIARVARELQLTGQLPATEPTTTSAPVLKAPGNLTMLRFLVVQAMAWVQWRLAGIVTAEHWNIGVVDAAPGTLVDATAPPARWLPRPPPGSFVADPFGVSTSRGLLVLAEAYDYRDRLGRIVSVDLSTGEQAPAALPLHGHASYPYLLRSGDDVYCVPENASAGAVRLYRQDQSGWVQAAVLLTVPLVDATVFLHSGRWWLLGTRADDDVNAKLHAWWSDELTGPWQPHALNPLKTDVRSARPAGVPFEHHGSLIRPAQDCSRSYGGSVTLLEVTRLTPTEFAEHPVGRVEPDPHGPYPDGLHTVAAVGDLTLIDGNAFGFSGVALRRALLGRLGR